MAVCTPSKETTGIPAVDAVTPLGTIKFTDTVCWQHRRKSVTRQKKETLKKIEEMSLDERDLEPKKDEDFTLKM